MNGFASSRRLEAEIELLEGNTVRLRRENVLQTSKKVLLCKLCNLIPQERKNEFLQICVALEGYIRAKNRESNEDLTEYYGLFDPTEKKPQHFEAIIEQKEFLRMLLEVIKRCRFKMLTDSEWKLATSSTYLFHLPARLDKSELDGSLFENFRENFEQTLPEYSQKKFLVFRRGIDVDRTSGHFYRAKANELCKRFWRQTFIRLWKWMGNESNSDLDDESYTPSKTGSMESPENYQSVKRIHINSFKLNKFFKRITLQEPTFDRMILIYSPIADVERGPVIHLKHYKSIPMADMELLLPEKKNPRLPTLDWIILLISALLASVLIVKSYQDHHQFGFPLALGVIAAFFSYCLKVYYTFNQNLLEYERLISKLLHDKQLDCGHGALLHVCEESTQLEVKEAILAYYVLLEGEVDSEELCRKCNKYVKTLFDDEMCIFEADNFVHGLLQNNILIKDNSTKQLQCLTLQQLVEQREQLLL